MCVRLDKTHPQRGLLHVVLGSQHKNGQVVHKKSIVSSRSEVDGEGQCRTSVDAAFGQLDFKVTQLKSKHPNRKFSDAADESQCLLRVDLSSA